MDPLDLETRTEFLVLDITELMSIEFIKSLSPDETVQNVCAR